MRSIVIAGCAAAAIAQSSKPNILLIVADDLGWHDCGFTGSNISTPNIDKLVREGVRMENYYAQPVCTPSRAAMMTGRYPIAYGLQTYVIDPAGVDYGLNLNETLLPQLLKQYGGYQTHAVGKWHLGMSRWEYTPTFRGFDSFHGYYSGGQDYFTHTESGGFDLHIDAQPNCGPGCSVSDWGSNGTYSTFLYAAAAEKVIASHDPSKGPLFLYLPFQAVHSPDQVPQSYIDKYNETIPAGYRRTFAGMLDCLDEGIGNVTAALASSGLLDNTLILFVADNGGPITEPNCPICGDHTGTTNYPLRGGKHSLWEGGVRVTAAAWGSMLQNTGGNRSGLMHHVDLLPTLLQAAGIPPSSLPPGSTQPLHGINQWDFLRVGPPSFPSSRNEVLLNIDPLQAAPYDMGHGNAAIRVGQWKLLVGMTGPPWGYMPEALPPATPAEAAAVAAATGPLPSAYTYGYPLPPASAWSAGPPALWPLNNQTVQLFNIDLDPSERMDVSAQNPAIVSQLLARLAYWGSEVQVVPLYWNASVDPNSNPSLRNGTWTPWLPYPAV